MKAHIFYPASKFVEDNLEKGVTLAKSLGFEFNSLISLQSHYYNVAKLEERKSSFLSGLLDDQVEVLWAVRGGYGTVDWLSEIPAQPQVYKGKKIIGYSDLTSLHSFLSNIGVSSIHGPMIATQSFVESQHDELNSLMNSIKEETQEFEIKNPNLIETTGRLVGGNLTVLASLMGTPWQLNLHPGDILFLEDIAEAHYALARSLRQLSYTHNFNKCIIVWGHLTNCNHDLADHYELISALMEPYGNHWIHGLKVGHENSNYSLRLNCETRIEESKLIQD